MITFLNLDTDSLKEELKEAKVMKTSSKAFINKRFKDNYNLRQRELNRNDFLIQLYSASKTTPVRIGNLIINYKFLSAFLKKIKGFTVVFQIKESSILLTYQKGKNKGQLELDDLSSYFDGFQYVPVAVFENGTEA